MKNNLKKLLSLLMIIISCWPLSASSIAEKKLGLEELYEQKAIRILKQHLSDNEYLIYVNLEFDEEQIKTLTKPKEKEQEAAGEAVQLPMLPYSVDSKDIKNIGKKDEPVMDKSVLDLLDVADYIQKIQVNLTFDEGVSQEKSDLIVSALKTVLQVDETRSDEFVVDRKKLVYATATQLEESQMKKKELAFINAQISEMDAKMNDMKAVNTGLRGLLRGLETPFAAGLFGIAVILVALVMFTAVNKGTSSLVKAMNNFGGVYLQGKEKEAEAITQSSNNNSMNTSGAMAGAEGEKAEGQSGNFNDEESNKEFDDMLAKIRLSSEKKPHIVAKFILDYLENKNNIVKAVAVLESLGENISKHILKLLPKKEISKIGTFMQKEGSFASINKIKKEACFDMYGKLSADELLENKEVSQLSPSFLAEFNDDQLAQSLSSRSAEEIVQVFNLMTPDRSARIFNRLGDLKTVVSNAMKQVGKIDYDMLKIVIDYLRMQASALNKEDKNAFDPSQYLATMLKNLNPQDEQSVIDAISSERSLMRALKENYITFSDFVRLDKELVRMIVGTIPVKQVANLLSDVSDEIKDLVVNALPDKIRLIALDELEVINRNSVQKRRAIAEGAKIKLAIVQNMKNMIAQGLVDLDSLLGGQVDTPTEAAAETTPIVEEKQDLVA